MKPKKLQILFLSIGILCAIFATYLSLQVNQISEKGEVGKEIRTIQDITEDLPGKIVSGGSGASVDIESAAGNGALGFCILSGICFLSTSILSFKQN